MGRKNYILTGSSGRTRIREGRPSATTGWGGGGWGQEAREQKKTKIFFFFLKDKTQRDKHKTITIEEREDSHIFKGLVQNLPE